MPSPVFLLLKHTDWSSVREADEDRFMEGLKGWELDPGETVGGQNLLLTLLRSYGRRETPFLNGMVRVLLDRGVDPAPALADEACSARSADAIQWGHYPTLVRVLQSHSQGQNADGLDLGLTLLDILANPANNTTEVIAQMERLSGQGLDQKSVWERPIEGIKAAVWLALQSVDGPGEASGWQNAFRSWGDSGVHKMRVLRAILGAALKDGALTDEEAWVVHVTMASLVSQRKGSQNERKQTVVLRKAFQGPLFDQSPSQARKTQEAVSNQVAAWSDKARQRLVRALMQAATDRLGIAGSTSRPACVRLVRFALELGITPTSNVFANLLATKVLTYWRGDLDQLATDWAKTEEGVQLGVALWASSWMDKADPGSLAKEARTEWVTALGEAVNKQSKPLGAQWPTVQALVAGALVHPGAHEEWKPMQALINQSALEARLESGAVAPSVKPRL